MKQLFLALHANEDGAVTVDFVVLTAAICLLGFVIVTTFSDEAVELAEDSSSFMENQCSESNCD